MAGDRKFDIAVSKWMGASGVAMLIAASGCSLLSSKEEAPVNAPATRVSTNANDVPLPVEINNDISKIIGGGGAGALSSGAGRVNVNVNVNFNGRGWTKVVSESNDAGEEISRIEKPLDSSKGSLAEGERAPAASEATDGGHENEVAAPAVGGKTKRYVVKPGDTLMKIAFESYGSVYRWREILNANKGKIANYSALTPGTELTINGVGYVVIERNGKPYLIVRNDTLGKISRKVYGTNSFWRELWKNNPQLIRNPHKIYAGFTMYYRDKSELGQPVRSAKSQIDNSVRVAKPEVEQPIRAAGSATPKLPAKLPAKRVPANKSRR